MTADADQLVSELVNEVFLASGALTRAGDDLTAAHALTAARWLVLGALQEGPRSIAGIARARGLRRQSVRESTQRLERDGLLTRVSDLADRRAPLLALTAAGQDALLRIEPKRAAWADGVATAVSPDDLRAATALLRTIRLHLEGTAGD